MSMGHISARWGRPDSRQVLAQRATLVTGSPQKADTTAAQLQPRWLMMPSARRGAIKIGQ